MKKSDVLKIIPVALQELHDEGHERVYVDQLGEQVTRHDETYLRRRGAIRKALGHFGVNISELPYGHSRPGAYKMYTSLRLLEEDGVVSGEFEQSHPDDRLPRRQYFLVDTVQQSPLE